MDVEIPVSIDILVACNDCGATLEVFSYPKSNVVELEVVPCRHCLKLAEEDGYANGKGDAEDTNDRFDLGYEVGKADGAQEALEEYIMDGGIVP